MQLTTIGQTLWRGASQGTRLAEAGAGDPDVQERLRKVKLAKALRESGRGWDEIQGLLGISRPTYYRWERALREEGLAGLKPKSRRPKRTRGKRHWRPELLLRVEELRKENPTWGRWPIWVTLRKEGYAVSERTVGRILAYLEGRGRVESVARFLARRGRGKARGRGRRPYARRKPRGYEVQAPGDLVQVDTLGVTLGPGEVVRQFSAVDLCCRYALGEVHGRATARLAGAFLSRLVAEAPFPIRAVQVDGGSEFMAEFED